MSPEAEVSGERTVAQVGQARSRAIRTQHRLALALVSVIGVAILSWYYLHVAEESRARRSTVSVASKAAASSEMKLPPLDTAPRALSAPLAAATPLGAASHADAPERAPADVDPPAVPERPAFPGCSADSQRASPEQAAPANAALARLTSPVLAQPATARGAGLHAVDGVASDPPGERDVDESAPAAQRTVARGASPGGLGEVLVPTVTAPVQAALVPTRRWLLPKGSFLDCTLETAIDSTLAGMTSCVLATDVFGADGRVVLLERGTKLVGETRGEARGGQARLAVLWSEARTPTGVVVGLASPGTDALGRAGIPGAVDAHVGQRFGAAVLLSLIDGVVTAVASRQQGSGSVIYNAQGSRDVATEALRNTINIPPTIRVAPGARIQVLVARDIDFRSVYRLIPRAER
jgi:type IV secretion system protein VirB10